MRINIVGTGNMGRSIAVRALTGGHAVRLVNPKAGSAQPLADGLKQRFPDGEVAYASSVGQAELTVFALPYDAALEVSKSARAGLSGQVLVDISNPVDFTTMDALSTPPGTSAAEQIQENVGTDVPVVKAFNTTFAALLETGEGYGAPLDVFIAGDSQAAKDSVADFVRSAAMRPLDVGPLRRARELEAMGFLHIAIQQPLALNWQSAIKLLS
ncbi:NADPH-dependent F420 reductase [Streptomyces chlorus]|uniref:NADPH-dependent F420 reductase n=1 Tax=Streptomyces chlorus TaxID=887452 RepID=A0ABW1E274_9ACTN